jgi:hypothetical protein
MSNNNTLRYAIALTLSCIAATAHGQTAAAKGQRALLTVNIQVDGASERHSRSEGVDITWKTTRTYDAKFEMTAAAATTASRTPAGRLPDASLQPNADMLAIQKKIEACGDNSGCQMAVAAEMMQSQEIQAQMKKAGSAAPRYQSWEVVDKGSRTEVRATYVEEWHGVFLTATREETKCKLLAPVLAGGTLSAQDRETLLLGSQGIAVEVDLQSKTNQLLLSLGAHAQGDMQCTNSIGSKSEQVREAKRAMILPTYKKDTEGWIAGGTSTNTTLARGESTFDMERGSTELGANLPPTPPLKVKVRWELNRL